MDFSLEKLRDYVPLAEKMAFIREAAGRCFDRIELRASEGENSLPLPPMYQRNMEKIERYILGGFVRLYLQQEVQPPEEDPWLISREDYDRWHGEGWFAQVYSGLFGNLVEKEFFQLRDLFLQEVASLEKVMNDPVSRLLAAMQMQTTPEAMNQAAEGLRQAKGELEAYLKEKQAAAARSRQEEAHAAD